MIRVLSKQVSDKIAAGEVVERPVSIMKELVENAIDAGATTIVVEIKNGGRTYMRVTDNGCGIPADQVELAFLRHATSKITDAEDLDHIQTLGFRGEALSSIAAVTRTEIITKEPQAKVGTRIMIHGGEVVDRAVTGCPDGTTVIARDLFYNTPARMKFMKPDATESGLIIDFISQIALAYPKIRFRMINNEVPLFSTTGNANRLQGIHTLYGKVNSEKLLPLQGESPQIRLEGFISDPGETRANRKSQIYFINGRVIHNKLIDRAIEKAYAQRLFEGRHPVAYLFLEVAPEDLDVNIHPNKREVRFHRESEVEAFIKDVISRTLQQGAAVPELVASHNSFKYVEPTNTNPKITPRTTTSEPNQAEFPSNSNQIDIKSLLSTIRNEHVSTKEETRQSREIPTTVVREIPLERTSTNGFFPVNLQVMGVVFATYIVASDEDTLYFVDQHAAHERILYEKIMAQLDGTEKVRQTIMLPFTFRCSFSEEAGANQWATILEEMGFTIELFGPQTYVVKEIPAFMSLEESERFLADFMDSVTDDMGFTNRTMIEKAASNACQGAVKGKSHLSSDEISQLLTDLSRCHNPLSCPHGRPTLIRFTQAELERKFRRT